VPFLAAPAILALMMRSSRRLNAVPILKAAEAQIRAAEHTLAAARDERLPSLSVNGDYGAIGENPRIPTERSLPPSLSISDLAGRPHGRRYQTGKGFFGSAAS
jgi:outer membrane protein TolC